MTPTYEQLEEWDRRRQEALAEIVWYLKQGKYYTLSKNIDKYHEISYLGVEETCYPLPEQLLTESDDVHL